MAPPRPSRPAHRLRSRLTALRRRVLVHRRLLAAALAGVAVVAVVRATAPPPPAMVDVTTAALDLPAGEIIEAGDLSVVRVPVALAPAGAERLRADELVGRALASPLRRGETVTDVRLVGAGLAVQPPGTTALPLRLPDADVADLLTVGDRVDVLATDPATGATETAAHGVRVLALPEAGADAASAAEGRVVVVAVRSGDAHGLASASVRHFLSVAFRG